MFETGADVALWCVGCRANQADRQELAARLGSRGVRITEDKRPAKVYIIYSCCVTSEAERDTRRLVRKALAINPNAKVILQGCLSNYMNIFDIKTIQGVDFSSVIRVDGHNAKDLEDQTIRVLDQGETRTLPKERIRYRPRTLIKVQNGCSRSCAYCVVPMVRGPGTSLAPAEVVGRISEAFQGGAAEVVLTGVNLGDWGKDLTPRRNLMDLLGAMESRFSNGPWIRLSSIEPWAVTRNLAEFMLKSRTFCPHLHVPLQSGDPSLLERMGRSTDLEQLAEVLGSVLDQAPGFSVGLDLIAGLPTESVESHQRSVAFVESLGVAYLHVFGYSPRRGTRAETMDHRPEKSVTSKRVRELIDLGGKKTRTFLEKQVGQTLEAVVTQVRNGSIRGMTGNYIEVTVPREAEHEETVSSSTLGARVRISVKSIREQGRYVNGSIPS